VRLFVALVPPAAVIDALPAVRSGARPTPSDQLHVTLAFLGEQEQAEPIALALDAVSDCPAPLVRLAGAGRFGSAVWLGMQGDLVTLRGLARCAQDAVRSAGVVLEPRTWHPHLTIARGGRVPGLERYEGPVAAWDEVRLVRSHLGRGAARHEPLAGWRLPQPAPVDPPEWWQRS
jgi:2'-5' RNA ligase